MIQAVSGNLLKQLLRASSTSISCNLLLPIMTQSQSSSYSSSFSPESFPATTFKTQILPTSPSSSIAFTSNSSTSSIEPIQTLSIKVSDPQTLSSLLLASSHLRQNQLVAFPTETVYGLGGSALSIHSTTSIFSAKKRPMDNPLIVHVSDLDMLDSILPNKREFDWTQNKVLNLLIRKFWPGALTLLFPISKLKDEEKGARLEIPSTVTCGLSTVAIRMPVNPLARALIGLSGLPIAAPSANASGRPSPTKSKHVMKDLGGELDRIQISSPISGEEGEALEKKEMGRIKYILEGGDCKVGVESTVIDCITNQDEVRILRPGGVSVEEIKKALRDEGVGIKGDPITSSRDLSSKKDEQYLQVEIKIFGKDKDSKLEKDQMENPTTPGMKYRHYAPDAKVVMLMVTSSSSSQSSENNQSSNFISARSEKERISTSNQNDGKVEQILQKTKEVFGDSKKVDVINGNQEGSVISSLPSILREEILGVLEKMRGEGSMRLGKKCRIGLMCREDSELLKYFRSLEANQINSSHKSQKEEEEEQQLKSSNSHQQDFLLPPLLLDLSQLLEDQDLSSSTNLKGLELEIYPFSLGNLSSPNQSAQRIFDGLRSLDEGPLRTLPSTQNSSMVNGQQNGPESFQKSDKEGCDLILVQGQTDEGMGLAVMNRLRKAASQVFLVDF